MQEMYEVFDKILDKVMAIETANGRLPQGCVCPKTESEHSLWYCPVHGEQEGQQ